MRNTIESDHPRRVTAYVGAGGGGDTVSALVRALAAPPTEDVVVYGAGYSAAVYEESLRAGVESKTPGYDYDRKPFTGDRTLIDAYLHGVGVRTTDGDGSVFQVTVPHPSVVGALFDDLRTDISLPAAEQHAGFKYRSLLDAVNAVDQLKLPFPLFMFHSVADLSDASEVRASYEALSAHWTASHTKVETVVLLDFGGDIVDIVPTDCSHPSRPLSRDTTVLMMALRFLRTGVIDCLRLEIYGPGVDAHDTINNVMHRLELLEQFSHIVSPRDRDVTVESFVGLIAKHMQLLKHFNLLAPGRATANWLEVYTNYASLSHELFLADYLSQRNDFKKLSAESQRAFIANTEQHVSTAPRGLEDFAQVVMLRVTPGNVDEFIARVCAPQYAQFERALLDG
jgi:hypothetical protein